MIPLRFVESEREDFDQPVVELWRADEFVGMVFWDDETTVVQIYPDGDGDVHDLELGDLIRVLELADRIVGPADRDDDELGDFAERYQADRVEAAGEEGDWEDEDPMTLALVSEFDPQVAVRTDDGEGFFRREVAEDFIERCNELRLAVVEMDGFDLEDDVLKPRPRLNMIVAAGGITEWGVFRPAANAQAMEILDSWPKRDSLVVAFVVQQPDGETFVA